MFELAQQELKEYNLQLEQSIVKPLENGVEGACTVRLVIENYNTHPVFLPANLLIGHLQPAKCLSQDEATKVLHSQVNFVSSGSSADSNFQQRCKAVLEMIYVDRSTLEVEEYTALNTLMMEYADIFAVNSAEIERIDLVHYQINTGYSDPVKQQARRIPFALRPKVEQMINKMLELGVIEESSSPCVSSIVLVSMPDGSM